MKRERKHGRSVRRGNAPTRINGGTLEYGPRSQIVGMDVRIVMLAANRRVWAALSRRRGAVA